MPVGNPGTEKTEMLPKDEKTKKVSPCPSPAHPPVFDLS